MSTMNDVKLRFLSSFQRIDAPKKVVAAVSGGADSVALLYLLKELQAEGRCGVECVHVHHGLRETADADEDFVQKLCEQWCVSFTSVHVTVNPRLNTEQAAREARYQALREQKTLKHCSVIAVAHHMEDQAETVMMHLMHGSGGRGLAGMAELSGDIWRPLLGVHRHELVEMLTRLQIFWCTDETNEDCRYTRNAVRHHLIPKMQEIYPSCVERLADTAQIAFEDEKDWNQRVEQWLSKYAGPSYPGLWCCKTILQDESIAMQRRILVQLCTRLEISVSFYHIESLRALLEKPAGTTINLPNDACAYMSWERMHILLPDAVSFFRLNGEVCFTDSPTTLGDGVFTQAFDADMISMAVLRTPQKGDRIHPLGAKGSQPLKQYFIDRKIDKPFRATWPVLAKDNLIYWVIGVGAAQTAALTGLTNKMKLGVFYGTLPDGKKNEGGSTHE